MSYRPALEDEDLEATHSETQMYLLAEHWKTECLKARLVLRELAALRRHENGDGPNGRYRTISAPVELLTRIDVLLGHKKSRSGPAQPDDFEPGETDDPSDAP